nr:TetR/AcrR family transcriptional regulator [uncultured Clostridium sp.]
MTFKKERTREHILRISYDLFAEHGFNEVSMKDVCEATEMSRGGLYSHFSSTKEIFEAILEKLNEKDAMNFHEEIERGISAVVILDNALALMKDEMNHAEDSLSLAMYEYAGNIGREFMDDFNKAGEKKWIDLIEYGIQRREFNAVNSNEIVNIILYVYQGVRMWSRIVTMKSDTIDMIIGYIKKQLLVGDEIIQKTVGVNCNED